MDGQTNQWMYGHTILQRCEDAANYARRPDKWHYKQSLVTLIVEGQKQEETIFARAETVPAEFFQVKEQKENVGSYKKRRLTAIFDRGRCV